MMLLKSSKIFWAFLSKKKTHLFHFCVEFLIDHRQPLLWNLLSSPATPTPRVFLMQRKCAYIFHDYGYIFYDLYFLRLLASWLMSQTRGRWAPLCILPTVWQWYFPLTLQLTSQPFQVCLAWHRNLNQLAATGVDDLLFSFFVCLDSCGRNSAGVWCQHRISTLAQRPAALKTIFLLVSQHCLLEWVSWKPHPRARLPNQWVRISSSQ